MPKFYIRETVKLSRSTPPTFFAWNCPTQHGDFFGFKCILVMLRFQMDFLTMVHKGQFTQRLNSKISLQCDSSHLFQMSRCMIQRFLIYESDSVGANIQTYPESKMKDMWVSFLCDVGSNGVFGGVSLPCRPSRVCTVYGDGSHCIMLLS